MSSEQKLLRGFLSFSVCHILYLKLNRVNFVGLLSKVFTGLLNVFTAASFSKFAEPKCLVRFGTFHLLFFVCVILNYRISLVDTGSDNIFLLCL